MNLRCNAPVQERYLSDSYATPHESKEIPLLRYYLRKVCQDVAGYLELGQLDDLSAHWKLLEIGSIPQWGSSIAGVRTAAALCATERQKCYGFKCRALFLVRKGPEARIMAFACGRKIISSHFLPQKMFWERLRWPDSRESIRIFAWTA